MKSEQILKEIKAAGSESIKKIHLKHGAKEPFYGVKVEDLKKIQKKIKENQQQIALELFESGVGDAMYLAGLMADGSKMSKKELQDWVTKAEYPMISEYAVAWVASENADAWELALKWIDSSKATIASSGWSTISSIVATWPDEKLDIAGLKKLLMRVQKEITNAPNRVRYCMNNFVIAVGSFVKDLNKEAIETGKKIGSVEVDMGGTSCKVPFAPDYIKKVMDKGYLGKKKKTAKC
ncbi:MAG TPA: DNA alkylation repair protein [Chitinophagaceae bacterium]|nr:DNA alkylation repair protein [Chitinophagaceae bacterium]